MRTPTETLQYILAGPSLRISPLGRKRQENSNNNNNNRLTIGNKITDDCLNILTIQNLTTVLETQEKTDAK